MRLAPDKLPAILLLLLSTLITVEAQSSPREIAIGIDDTLEIVNRSGKVTIKTVPVEESGSRKAALVMVGDRDLSESAARISSAGGRVNIAVPNTVGRDRIDLVITMPEWMKVKIETSAGAIEAFGNFRLIEAKTQTGTIITDIPVKDVSYHLTWTESRPRFLADFEVGDIKERSRGKFEIKGRHTSADSSNHDAAQAVSLKLSTARGIILLNVPANEVMSDLRERPLTEAAKAIVRSGDSLLMEAVRRASPKYYGDYTRALGPLLREPTFAKRSDPIENPSSPVKSAFVRVTDLKNRAIPNLRVRDFEVLENGRESEILSLEASEAPFNLVLLLDVSGSVDNYVNFIRKAARNFVDTVGREDRVAIVIFNEDVKVLSTFTVNKQKLSESLDTFDAGGGTAYYDALGYAISDTLRPLRGERTAIVVLTDGDDNRSFLPFDSLAGSIQESGALIYPLYVPSTLIALAAQGVNADIDPLRRRYMALTPKSEGEGERLAELSGGVYYPISDVRQIQEAYEDIVVQMRSAYKITFRSSLAVLQGDGAVPRIRIRAKPANSFTRVTSIVPASKE